MKYKFELEINAPYTWVMELREDPENLPKWQPELTGYAPISGDRKTVGSQSRLSYNMNGRPLEIIESITARNPPHEFSAKYVTTGMVNQVTNRFAEIGPESTFWQYESEVVFTNWVMKLIGMFMANAFRDQSWRYMNLFKQFVEAEYDQRR